MQFIHTIAHQQGLFCSWVSTPLKGIAAQCVAEWEGESVTTEQLTVTLQDSMKQIPQYALCYLVPDRK